MILVGDRDLFAKIFVMSPGSEGVWRGKIVDGPWEELPNHWELG